MPLPTHWRKSRVVALVLAAGVLGSIHGVAECAEAATSPVDTSQSDMALAGEIWTNVPVLGERPEAVPLTIAELVRRAAPVL